MRDFPERTAPRSVPLGRTAAIGAALALTAGAVSSPTLADDLRHKQRSIQTHEYKAQADLDGSSAALRRAQNKLKSSQGLLTIAKARVTRIESALRAARVADAAWHKKLSQARASLARAEADLAATQAKVAAARTQAQQNALDMMLHPTVEAQQWAAVLGSGSFADVSRQVEYNKLYADHQAYVITSLSEAEDQLAVRQEQVAAAADRVSASAKQASIRVAAVKKLQADAVGARNRVARLVRSRAAAARAAKAAAQRDRDALNALKAQEAAIIAKIMAQSGGDLHLSGVRTNGMLSYPLRGGGVLTSAYGYRVNPVWGYWGLHNGDDFAAPCGTPEVAVRSGHIVSEYYSQVWGNRLFLDLGFINGHNYTAVYNHISRYAAGTGAYVARGQTVAYEGSTGWSTGCHIHFTLMRDGAAVNPMNYVR